MYSKDDLVPVQYAPFYNKPGYFCSKRYKMMWDVKEFYVQKHEFIYASQAAPYNCRCKVCELNKYGPGGNTGTLRPVGPPEGAHPETD